MLIGELSAVTGVPATTLRFYEGEGLLHEPRRTAGGYRDYEAATAERVSFIRQAQTAGLTLRQIGQILQLRDRGRAPCAHVADLVEERLVDVERTIRDLERARTELLAVRERLEHVDPARCDPASICEAIG